MIREAINDLIKWKYGDHRKPLLIRGARQVGKIWMRACIFTYRSISQSFFFFSFSVRKISFTLDSVVTPG